MNPGTGRRAGLSVLHRLKLVDQFVNYAIAKMVAHCDYQTDCQPLDDRGANVPTADARTEKAACGPKCC